MHALVHSPGFEVEALRVLGSRTPDVAILDINLGAGTSIAVAVELAGRSIPFVFATGNGDSAFVPGHLNHVPVVRKPYDAATILEHLRNLTRPAL